MIKVFAASLLLALNCAKAEAVDQVETGTPALLRTDRTGQNSIQGVSPKTASELMKSGQAVIIDVREPNEVEQLRIPGAINIPLGQLTSRLAEVEKNKSKAIITQCRTGNRSKEALKRLNLSGVNNVINLEGGIVAWEKAGLKTEKKCC